LQIVIVPGSKRLGRKGFESCRKIAATPASGIIAALHNKDNPSKTGKGVWEEQGPHAYIAENAEDCREPGGVCEFGKLTLRY